MVNVKATHVLTLNLSSLPAVHAVTCVPSDSSGGGSACGWRLWVVSLVEWSCVMVHLWWGLSMKVLVVPPGTTAFPPSQSSPTTRDEMRGETRDEMRGEMRCEMRGEMRDEMRGEMRCEMRGEALHEMRGETRDEM